MGDGGGEVESVRESEGQPGSMERTRERQHPKGDWGGLMELGYRQDPWQQLRGIRVAGHIHGEIRGQVGSVERLGSSQVCKSLLRSGRFWQDRGGFQAIQGSLGGPGAILAPQSSPSEPISPSLLLLPITPPGLTSSAPIISEH